MSTSVVTLVTGLQGNGKTLFTIASVMELAEREGRPVFYHGISELMLPWTPLENPEDWPDVPAGAIVVLDEAQKAYRLRASGSAVPRHVEALETLRHRGISLWLITQHPMLIDSNARRLCGRHLHLVRKFGGQSSMLHEWNAVRENCDKPIGRKDSIKKSWKFPKAVFGLYKSAEVHTVKRSIPRKVLMLVPMAVIALVAFGYVGYGKVWKPLAGDAAPAEAMQKAPGQKGGSGVSVGSQERGPVTATEYVASFVPRVPGLDYTAPVYDALTQVKRVPVPAACVTLKGRCQCYSQQGTRLQLDKNQCAQVVENGFFMAFDPDQVPVQKEAPPQQPQTVVQVGAMGEMPQRRLDPIDLAVFDEPETPRHRVRR